MEKQTPIALNKNTHSRLFDFKKKYGLSNFDEAVNVTLDISESLFGFMESFKSTENMDMSKLLQKSTEIFAKIDKLHNKEKH